MRLCYAGASKPSALAIAMASDGDITAVRSSHGDVNWGRRVANTELNPDISNTVNKRVMRQLFREHGVPMPRLIELSNVPLAIVDKRVVVGRPDKHTKGRGFWKISNQYELFQALHGTHRKQPATHFMEFIDAPREYRVHIFKGKSIRISEKLFGLTGETAHGSYITGRPRHDIRHVRRAAKKAVAAVGLDFGAVDVLANDTDCWVLEVNAAPGLGGSVPQLYVETFRRYFEGDFDE